LLKSGFDEVAAQGFLHAVCKIANDEELADRVNCVRTTADRLRRGEVVSEWTALSRLFNSVVASKVRDWLGGRLTEQIALPAKTVVSGVGVVSYSDLGNADRFACQHGDKVGYCSGSKSWYVWDGRRWALDQNDAVGRLGIDTARSIALEASQNSNRDLLMWAARSQSARAIDDMLRVAQKLLQVSRAAFDSDPWLFNCANGTIELKTGLLRDHDPRDRNSKLARVEFLPGATCPGWLAFLERVMAGNKALVAYLQRAVGYSLTGLTLEQCLFVMLGSGANGKSTFLTVMRALMGDYEQQTPMDTLMIKPSSSASNDLARLDGARFVTAGEAELRQRLAEAKIKQITGGDPITARFLYREFATFVPKFKLWLATNELPRIEGTDNGIWRRIHVIPFSITIPPDEQDRTLADKLLAELPGILNWAIQGCLDWQRIGLKPPDEVTAATRDYRSDMDVLAQFLEDRCVLEEAAEVTAKDLFANYVDWCDENGHKPLAQNAFGQRLKARGLKQTRIRKARKWVGVRLATLEDDLKVAE
jgi:putative DNA primase/helicase